MMQLCVPAVGSRCYADNEGSRYVCRTNKQYGDNEWRDTLPDGRPDHLPAVGGYAVLLTGHPKPESTPRGVYGRLWPKSQATKKGPPFGEPF